MPPKRKVAKVPEKPDPEVKLEPEVDVPVVELPTCPANCRVYGNGLHTCAVKHIASFVVEAFDTSGLRKHCGGDAFFIAIRGASRVRAKVTDMRDGTYGVEWMPTTSGDYSIAVSLFGVSLPGSPFPALCHMPYPHAANCEARGSALQTVVARASEHFEVLFRDRLGNVAQAVDLDVFVRSPQLHSITSLRATSRGLWLLTATCQIT